MTAAPDLLALAAGVYALVGLYGFTSPGFLASVNSFDVPRWPMAVLTCLLILGAVAIRRFSGDLVFRGIAAFIAVCSAAFARVGVRELGGPYLTVEWILFPLAALLALGAMMMPTSTSIRLSLAYCPIVVALVYVAAMPGVTTWPHYAVVYAAVTILAGSSVSTTWRSSRRRTR